MNRDSLDERYAQLFASARKEAPSEGTRRRISAALRAQPHPVMAKAPGYIGPGRRLPFVLVAGAFCVLVLVFLRTPHPVDISAEPVVGETAQRQTSDAVVTETAPSEKATAAPPPPEPKEQATTSPSKQGVKAPPSLEQELAAMQDARATLDRGDATSALVELDRFDRSQGWHQLAVEASLLRIEALVRVGRTDEAGAEARHFVETNPNNPLVDRAKKFAHPPAAPVPNEAVKPARD